MKFGDTKRTVVKINLFRVFIFLHHVVWSGNARSAIVQSTLKRVTNPPTLEWIPTDPFKSGYYSNF